MKKILFFVLFFPTVLLAQINESDSLKFKANLSLSGFWQRGNVTTSIFRARTDVNYRPWKKWVFKTQNSYVYQAFGGLRADEDLLSLNFLYFNPDQKVYPFILGFGSTSFRREIRLRYLFGAGFTVNVLRGQQNWLKFSLSSEYEQTDFERASFNRPVYNDDNSIHTFRGTLWINGNYHLFKNKLILTHESFVQPSLERSDNYRWEAEISLGLPLWKFLDFKINYRQTVERIVITGQQQQDRFLTFGFTLKSY
ncbi:MAG: DUF481 domain-containing protein [Bacteroidota bacterium]